MPKGKDTHIQLRISSKIKDNWQLNAEIEEKTLTQYIIDVVNDSINRKDLLEEIQETIIKEFKIYLEPGFFDLYRPVKKRKVVDSKD